MQPQLPMTRQPQENPARTSSMHIETAGLVQIRNPQEMAFVALMATPSDLVTAFKYTAATNTANT